jgi:hypothetical protein
VPDGAGIAKLSIWLASTCDVCQSCDQPIFFLMPVQSLGSAFPCYRLMSDRKSIPGDSNQRSAPCDGMLTDEGARGRTMDLPLTHNRSANRQNGQCSRLSARPPPEWPTTAGGRRETYMPLTPAQRSLRAKVAAHTLHAQRDGAELTRAAREAFLRSFEPLVDPDGVLPPDVRRRRAEHARRAHMARLSLASSRARARRRAESVP